MSALRSLCRRSASSAERIGVEQGHSAASDAAFSASSARGIGRLLPRVAHHVAVAEADEPGGEARDVRFVRDDHDRGAFAVQFLEQRHQLDRGAAVERAGRLVGEQHFRVVDERPRDRDALLLSAGKLRRPVMHAVAKAHTRAGRSTRGDRRSGCPAGIDHRQFDIAERVEPVEQMELLEHEADLAVAHGRERVAAEPATVVAVEPVGARGRPVEAADDIHEGRFAGARRAHHGDEIAGVDAERDVVQRLHRLVAEPVEARQLLEFDQRHGKAQKPNRGRVRAASVHAVRRR